MSRPVLPNQNSKYWGHDLNNYLLSLASDIDSLNAKFNTEHVETNVYTLENVGFVTGTYSIKKSEDGTNLWSAVGDIWTNSSTTTFNGNGLLLNGTIGVQTSSNNTVLMIYKEIENLDIFKAYRIARYKSDGSGRIECIDDKTIQSSFYNIFLYYAVENDGAIEVLLSQETLVDPCIIFAGTLDAIEGYTFIPRAFSAAKPLQASVKDCLEPLVSIIGSSNPAGNDLPLLGVPYYMMINGIQPNLPYEGTDGLKYQHQDCKKIVAGTKWYDWNIDTEDYSSAYDKNDIGIGCQYDLYLSVSGKIFALCHTLNNLYTDYNVQSKYDLRFQPKLRAGGLVYVGTYYSSSVPSSNVFGHAQTGGIPPILNATQYNWNVINLENKEFHSTNDENLQDQVLDVEQIYLMFSGTGAEKNIKHYVSNVIDSVTPITFASNFSVSYSTGGAQNIFRYFYKTEKCAKTDKCLVSASYFDFKKNTTYYFKCEEAFKQDLLSIKTSPRATGVSGWSTYFTLVRKPNRYKISLNPSKTVSGDGCGIINLNLPEYDNMMIPVFGNSYVSTTSKTLTFKEGSSYNIIGPDSMQINGSSNSSELKSNQLYICNNQEKKSSYVNSGSFSIVNTNNAKQCLLLSSEYLGLGLDSTTSYNKLQITTTNPTYYYANTENQKVFYIGSNINDNSSKYASLVFCNTATEGQLDSVYIRPNIMVAAPSRLIANSSKTHYTDIRFQSGYIIVGNAEKIQIGADTKKAGMECAILDNGDIYCLSTNYTSDRRYKKDIQPILASSCLKAVENLDVFSYTYIDDSKTSLGVMAQDIEQYLPEYAHLLVHEDSTGKKHVEEHKLLFILWQAVKELIAKQKD